MVSGLLYNKILIESDIMGNLDYIDIKRVVDCIADNGTTEFEKRRNEKEYERFQEIVEEIASEPYHVWPEEKLKRK